MASEIAVALLSLLGGGAQGFAQAKERGRREEADVTLAVENLLEQRRGRRETFAHGTSEREAGQEFQAGEGVKEREFQAGQAGEERSFRTGEREGSQIFQSGENALDRTLREMGIRVERGTALEVAKIREGDEMTDPDTFIRKMVSEAYISALKDPVQSQNASAKALEAYTIANDLISRQGLFGPTGPSVPTEEGPRGPGFLEKLFGEDKGEPLGIDLRGLGINYQTPSLRKYNEKKKGVRTLN